MLHHQPPSPFPCCHDIQELLRWRKLSKLEALTVAFRVGECCSQKLTISHSLFLWRPSPTQAGIDWEVRPAPTMASLTAARHSSDEWLVEEIAGSTSCFCFLKPSFKSFTARSVELEDLKGKSISYQFQLDSEVEYHLSGLPPGQRLSRNLQRLPHLSSESQASVNSL